jgi:hypothetical protein
MNEKQNEKPKKPIPKEVSEYMSYLGKRSGINIRGTKAARDRSALAVAGRQRKRREKKAAVDNA